MLDAVCAQGCVGGCVCGVRGIGRGRIRGEDVLFRSKVSFLVDLGGEGRFGRWLVDYLLSGAAI